MSNTFGAVRRNLLLITKSTGRYVFDLAFENIIKASVVSHPAGLQVPADFEVCIFCLSSYMSIQLNFGALQKYIAVSKAPLLINSCPVDDLFPPEAFFKAKELFGDGKFAPGYRSEYFEGCVHGFAVRGDMSDPRVKAGKEGAFKAAVEWFIENL